VARQSPGNRPALDFPCLGFPPTGYDSFHRGTSTPFYTSGNTNPARKDRQRAPPRPLAVSPCGNGEVLRLRIRGLRGSGFCGPGLVAPHRFPDGGRD
jgi:hypothetical protein